jgi:alanine racemase
MSTQNRAEAVIDLNAIEANIKFLMAKSGKPALAVVKADAYGHGLIPVAQRALKAGATWLGVALLDEAIALRESGINAPILAWLTPITDDFSSALENEIDIAIPSIAHLEVLLEAAEKNKKVPRIHLEVDTGMSRGGALLEWNELVSVAGAAEKNGSLKVIGIWSHFARADEPGHEFNLQQRETFERAVASARSIQKLFTSATLQQPSMTPTLTLISSD